MRPVTLLALLALSLPLIAACGFGDDDDAGTGISVVATTAQIGALVREVAGDGVSLTVLIGPGVEAHDFEPDPGQVRKLNDADVILRNGIGLDDFLDDVIEGSARGKVVTVTEGARVEKGAEGEGEDDPHVWHDIDNAKQMTLRIAEALAEAEPGRASDYDARSRAYLAKLDETDREIRAMLGAIPAAQRKIVTNHDAFGYFIRRYELTYVGAIFPSSGQGDVSARQVADLENLIRKEGVRAIFAEEELDSGLAQEIARDTGVKIVDDLYADSLGPQGSDEGTIHGMLLANARKIADALR